MRICDKDCCQKRSGCWNADNPLSVSGRGRSPWSVIYGIRFNSSSWQRDRRNSMSSSRALVFGEIPQH